MFVWGAYLTVFERRQKLSRQSTNRVAPRPPRWPACSVAVTWVVHPTPAVPLVAIVVWAQTLVNSPLLPAEAAEFCLVATRHQRRRHCTC